MSDEEAQEIWNDYFERVLSRRISEAEQLNKIMLQESAFDGNLLALDFTIFGSEDSDVIGLLNQLKENYEVSSRQEDAHGYSTIRFTTRPFGVEISSAEHIEWLKFIYEVTRSYGCVLSTWSFEDTKSNRRWSSEDIEDA